MSKCHILLRGDGFMLPWVVAMKVFSKKNKLSLSAVTAAALLVSLLLQSSISAHQDAAALSTSPTVYDGSIAMVTIAFGHAYTDQLTAMNNMTKYHFTGNISPVGTKIGKGGYLTQTSLLNLKSQGWQILSHSMTHPRISSTTPNSVLQYEIVQSKQNLTNMGLCITGYESPFDIITTNSASIIKSNYKYTVINPDHQNTVYSITHDGAKWGFPVAIHYYGVGKGIGINNFAAAKPLVDYAIAHHTYLILNFHQIDNISDPYSTPPPTFWQILQYIKQKSDAGQLKVENSVQALGISCP
jgi:hypothetical protein